MTYTRRSAKPLLTEREYELFSASLGDRISELSPAQLRQAVNQCRRARDKHRDLYRRQADAVIERSGGRGAAATANQRTAKKATIFAETLARFEKHLDRAEAAAARAKRDATLARAAKTPDPGPSAANRAERRAQQRGQLSGPAPGFMSGSAIAENRSTVLAGPTAKNISAHRSAVGRRNQAKRDSR